MNLDNSHPESCPNTSIEKQPALKLTRPRRCKLEHLPAHIRQELDELICCGCGERTIKKTLLERHGAICPILHAALGTYRAYIRLYKPQILKRQRINQLMMTDQAENMQDVKMVMDSVLNPESAGTPQDRSKAFRGLLSRIEGRIKILEEAQDSDVPDPRTESVIAAYMKEEKAILETLTKMAPQFEKDKQKEFLDEINYYTQVFINVVINSYRIVNGNTNLSLFAQTFQERLEDAVRNYRVSKQQVLKQAGF